MGAAAATPHRTPRTDSSTLQPPVRGQCSAAPVSPTRCTSRRHLPRKSRTPPAPPRGIDNSSAHRLPSQSSPQAAQTTRHPLTGQLRLLHLTLSSALHSRCCGQGSLWLQPVAQTSTHPPGERRDNRHTALSHALPAPRAPPTSPHPLQTYPGSRTKTAPHSRFCSQSSSTFHCYPQSRSHPLPTP